MIVSDATIVSAFVLEPYPVHPSFSAYLVEFISGQIFPVWQNPRTGAYRAYNRKQPTVRNAPGEAIRLAAEVAPGSTVNIAVHMDDTAPILDALEISDVRRVMANMSFQAAA
jgi:hypothetical protein